jgi:beta-glucosidase
MKHSNRLPLPAGTIARACRTLLAGIALAACAAMSSGSEGARAEVHPQQWPAARSAGLVDPAIEQRISALLQQMLVEEKVGQVIQADISAIKPEDLRRYPLGSILIGGNSGPYGDERAPPAAWLKLTNEFHGVAIEPRPGHVPIPLIIGVDAVHGHNNVVGAVQFPHNIGLGAARDPELLRRISAATAEEVAATGIDWSFAPTVAMPQDVRWGRTYEGYAQNPALVPGYAAAAVEGLQGGAASTGKVQAGRIAATAKHFLADGATRGGEDEGDAQVSEAELIRVHAPNYVRAIDAGVMTIMASFSSWQGQKMHGNHALLTDVLKGRMGFDGFVIGDWNGHAQVPGCTKVRCPAAFNAGVDMFMAPDGWQQLFENTVAEVRSGEIPAARLDDAVRRILRVKFRLGLFEAARPYAGRLELVGSAAHRALAREAVCKSLVLLKNDGVLPIKAGARVLVTGPAAESIGVQSGGWSISWQGRDTTNADFPNGESIYAGIKAAIEAGGGTLVSDSGTSAAPPPASARPDVAVVVFGENPYAEYEGDLKFALYNPSSPLEQLRLLRERGIPVVSVFLSGRPLWVNPEINASNAFVAAWLPGTEGGGGVADVLVGDGAGKPRTDFTGKLSFSWPVTAAEASPASGRGTKPPLFAPGYGLSYAHGGAVRPLPEGIGAP